MFEKAKIILKLKFKIKFRIQQMKSKILQLNLQSLQLISEVNFWISEFGIDWGPL